MDVKAKLKEIHERGKNDADFHELLITDCEAALAQCGVSSVKDFIDAIGESDLLDEAEMSSVVGGASAPINPGQMLGLSPGIIGHYANWSVEQATNEVRNARANGQYGHLGKHIFGLGGIVIPGAIG